MCCSFCGALRKRTKGQLCGHTFFLKPTFIKSKLFADMETQLYDLTVFFSLLVLLHYGTEKGKVFIFVHVKLIVFQSIVAASSPHR